MKKTIIGILVLVLGFFSIGCNHSKPDRLHDEISRLDELVSCMERIMELEKEIERLQQTKTDSDIITELERQLWVLNRYIEKIDQRTRASYDWDNYIHIAYRDLVNLWNNDYNKLVYEFENHIFSFGAWCVGTGICDDGYEYVKLSDGITGEPQITLKTIYQNGETLSFLGKSLGYLTVFKNDEGLVLARLKELYYFQFPDSLFSLVNIEKPEDTHYGTLKETIQNEPSQVYIDITLKIENKYFIEEYGLNTVFETVEMTDNQTIVITLTDNELTQTMFVAILRILSGHLSERTVTIRT